MDLKTVLIKNDAYLPILIGQHHGGGGSQVQRRHGSPASKHHPYDAAAIKVCLGGEEQEKMDLNLRAEGAPGTGREQRSRSQQEEVGQSLIEVNNLHPVTRGRPSEVPVLQTGRPSRGASALSRFTVCSGSFFLFFY